jgi:hypothetical protein
MLKRILDELRGAGEPSNLGELSRKLDIDRSALDGMLMQLVRQGKLRELTAEKPECAHCSGCAEGRSSAAEGKVYAVVGPE